MVKKKIEELLELTPEIVKRRKDDLMATIRTYPGIEFLRTKAKIFDVQPWPFVSYIAHNYPEEFEELLCRYGDYDGAENRENVLEGLRETYILYSLMIDLKNEKESIEAEFNEVKN